MMLKKLLNYPGRYDQSTMETSTKEFTSVPEIQDRLAPARGTLTRPRGPVVLRSGLSRMSQRGSLVYKMGVIIT